MTAGPTAHVTDPHACRGGRIQQSTTAPGELRAIRRTLPRLRDTKHTSTFLCHHLIKTFLTGMAGWADRQSPDGTIVLTAPTGHAYITESHGGAMFPALAQSTGELDIPPPVDVPETDRAVMMPRRKQTREQDRRDRINAERRQRTASPKKIDNAKPG